MDLATVVVDILVGLWCVALLVGVVRELRDGTPRLAPISPQAQERYWLSWERITRRFVFQPWEAAQEADSLVVSLPNTKPSLELKVERCSNRFVHCANLRRTNLKQLK